MWSSYSVTGRPPVTGTANGNSSERGGEDSSHVVDGGTDGDPLLGLMALQLTVLVFISAVGTFANALVFAVFYRRPSLRTISNRFVLSLIMANLTSAAVSIPGHIYQLLMKPLHQEQPERFQGHHQFDHHYQAAVVNSKLNAGSSIGDEDTYVMGRLVDESTPSWFSSWHWHKQGLDGLTVLVSLASVLSILLISLDRYYAVNSPLHYSIIVTRQKSMAMIVLVWMVAVILSAPVWAGSVLLQHYAPITNNVRPAHHTATAYNNNKDNSLLFDNNGLVNNETLYGGGDGEQFYSNSSRDQQNQQQYLMNLCYSISLILFGFVWPLAALCWLYLRMYEAALKNSARTRRQSLCSNTNNNANAMDGTVGAAVVAAASTVAATASSNAEPCFNSYGSTAMAEPQHSTLVDAISSVTTTAAALASENQASMRLLAAASAAAASASTPQRHRSNRYWLRLNGMQQQLLRLFWREQGRPLRTTAMVISSFTCCWLPFFVWLLPFQIHPSLIATTTTLDRVESRPTVTPASAGVFLARLAAFSNVLISPAIYVYRNQVAQREAGRVLLLLFCPLRHHRGQSTRYNSHDIATPLVMGGLGVGGMTTSQLHHPQSGESRLRMNSNAVNSSRRSSSLVTNNSSDSPSRKGSEEPMTVLALAQATVVNWRGRSGSTDCRLLTRNNGASLLADEASVAQQPILSIVPSPLLVGRHRRFSNNKPRASIPGACCTYSLDRRPSSTSSQMDANPPIEMRQRSQTICEARLTCSGRLLEHPAALSPHLTRVDPLSRTEGVGINTSPPNVITLGATMATASSCVTSDRSRSKKRHTSSSTTTAAAAAAAAAVAAAELKALNHSLAYYPSLDFFDIGLEDYGRRSATSSFSRFIQQQPAPLIPPSVSSFPQQQTTSATAVPLAHTVPQSSSSGSSQSGRRRRTCSFSKVMSRGSKQQTGANTRWPAVFGSASKQQQQDILGRSNASSMPSVQQIPSLVTAV